MARVKFLVEGVIEENLLREFLELLRKFDTEHTDQMHMNILTKGDMSIERALKAMDLEPNFPYYKYFPKV